MMYFHTGSPKEIGLYLAGSTWSIDSSDVMMFDSFLRSTDSDTSLTAPRLLPGYEMVIAISNKVLRPLRIDSVTVIDGVSGVRIPGRLLADPSNRAILALSSGVVDVQWNDDSRTSSDLSIRSNLRTAFVKRQFNLRVHTDRGSVEAKVSRYTTQFPGGILQRVSVM
jgi:hypothetical protein